MSTQKKISWGVVLSAITFVAGMQLKGCKAAMAYEHRVTAVEQRTQDADKRLDRIEMKIDRLLERVQ